MGGKGAIMPHANYAGTYRENTQASKPETGDPVKTREVNPCPQCSSTRNVRIIPKLSGEPDYFCTECLLQFNRKKVYSITDYKKTAKNEKQKYETPKYEKRITAGANINKRWVLSTAEKAVKRYLEIAPDGIDAEAVKVVSQEAKRSFGEVMVLIIGAYEMGWKLDSVRGSKSGG